MIREKEMGELRHKMLAQRLYAKYSDTGNIIPNKVTNSSLNLNSSWAYLVELRK